MIPGAPRPPAGALPAGLGRDGLVAEVRRVLDTAVPHATRVVVGVSGGPDSTALAVLCVEARADLNVHVAHVRHGLRDDAPDAAVAAEHAAALGLAFHERHADVVDAGEGLAAAARRARYALLAAVAGEVGARAVLVGHTADDQAETVLLNIARGAGLSGLAGMEAVTRHGDAPPVDVVRPLLWLRRSDVHAFVADAGLRTASDPSNQDQARRRVRAREEVLPALAGLSGGSGDPVGALTRLADLARDDVRALDTLADERARHTVVAWGPGRAVRLADLSALPRALETRVVRHMLGDVRGRLAGLDAAAVGQVLALEAGQACHVAGAVWVTRGGGWLAAVPDDHCDLPARAVHVPGRTPVPELGLALHAELVQRRGRDVSHPPEGLTPAAGPPGTEGPAWGVLAGPEQLVVRSRRSGDRLHGEAVADLLAEAGVPRALRGLVPVVASVDGEPRWIPGVASTPPRDAAVSSLGGPAQETAAVRLCLVEDELP